MNIKVEACGLKIGVDNSITEAIYNGKWGVRFFFLSNEFDNRYEMVLTPEEASALIEKTQESLDSITEVKKRQQLAGRI